MRPALLALLALLAIAPPVAAQAQSKPVREVYRDYRDDGVIEACTHERGALQETLDDLPAEADVDTPDLRPALEAAIDQHEDDDCDESGSSTSGSSGSGGSSTGSTATPAPTPAPSAPPPIGEGSTGSVPLNPPGDTPDSSAGSAPAAPSDDGGDSPAPPTAQDVTPVPEAAPPPAAAPEPTGPVATPSVVYRNADDGPPVSLLVVAAVALILALLALLYAFAARTGRLAGPRRAAREAVFRLGGTWGDFADWLRVGR